MNFINESAVFTDEELFFSVTDKKGIILGGNDVFTRISEYEDAELFQKPHNVIRHPDMPKTIFRLFWSYLKNEKSVVAYVKNATKSGRYYWVLSFAFPITEGYLSIRLKPSTEMLSTIEKLYKELLIREAENSDLDVHVEWLLKQLKTMGFDSYDKFMGKILPMELRSRNILLQTSKNSHSISFNTDNYKHIDKILQCVHAVDIENEKLQSAFSDVGMITKNLLIASAHLGKHAKTLTTIGSNLHILTNEVKAGAEGFKEQFENLMCADALMKFMGMVHAQIEMINYQSVENKNTIFTMTLEKCHNIIRKLVAENINHIHDLSVKIDENYLELENSISDFVRIALGMNVICITGKIEIAHLSCKQNIEELQEQLADLKDKNEDIKTFLSDISSQLMKIGDASKALEQNVLELQSRVYH